MHELHSTLGWSGDNRLATPQAEEVVKAHRFLEQRAAVFLGIRPSQKRTGMLIERKDQKASLWSAPTLIPNGLVCCPS